MSVETIGLCLDKFLLCYVLPTNGSWCTLHSVRAVAMETALHSSDVDNKEKTSAFI
jgi:hypothetical protein